MSPLTVRRPNIAVDDLNLRGDWMGGDAFRTQMFNATSMMFPVGEKYFIDAVRAAASQIEDPELRDLARDFVGQEAVHSALHRRFNQRLEQEQGLRNLAEKIIAQRIRWGERFGLREKLAITLGYEHFTATLGDAVLEENGWLDGAEPAMRQLWEWHAAEECEHRAASFELYRALGGGPARRIAWFFYVSLLFVCDTTLQTMLNLHRSGRLWRWRTWRDAARFMLRRGGFFATLIPAWFAYLRPGFHPQHRGDAAAAETWFAANADLFNRA